MPSDDELRRVAEDVRALARSLGRDIRSAIDRAREDAYGAGHPAPPAGWRSARDDLAVAGRAARDQLRQAQQALRRSTRPRRPRHRGHWAGSWAPPATWAADGDGADALDGADAIAGASAIAGARQPASPSHGPRPGCPPRWDNWGRRGRWSGRSSSTDTRPSGRDRTSAIAAAPAPPLRHRHDGSTVLGLLALVFGLAWLVAGTHLAQVSTEAVVAIALMVLGVATVVTARTDWALSRRSWPVVGGAALAVALLLLSASPDMPVGFRHLEFGARTIAPTAWADLPATIHGGFGRTVVDLTSLPTPPPAVRNLSVDGAAGRLEVTVPPSLKVLLRARLIAGQIEIFGVRSSGLRRIDNQTLNPSAVGPPLILEIQSGFGSVAITQPLPAAPAPKVGGIK